MPSLRSPHALLSVLTLTLALGLGGLLSSGCALAAGKGQTVDVEMRSGVLKRNYRLYVPSGYQKNKPAPLIIALHGGLGTGKVMAEHAGLSDDADRAGMLVAYPDGIGRGWNAGSCCGDPMEKQVNDVLFMRNLIEDVKSKYSVDSKRIYGTGFSNGAMLLHRVACEAPELFTAIAPVSGGIMVPECQAKTAPAVLLVQGRADDRIFWDGGTFSGTYRPSIKEIVASLRTRNQCSSQEVVTRKQGVVTCMTLKGCAAGKDVSWCGLDGVGHQWAGGKTILPRILGKNTDEYDTSAEVVKFFAAH